MLRGYRSFFSNRSSARGHVRHRSLTFASAIAVSIPRLDAALHLVRRAGASAWNWIHHVESDSAKSVFAISPVKP